MLTSYAAQRRQAIFPIASNTGFKSLGEREMTVRTSPIAVWYSRLSISSRVRACTSSNNRVFSIAMTAWSAKVLNSSMSFPENAPAVARATMTTPSGVPSFIKGTNKPLRMPTARDSGLCSDSRSSSTSGMWTTPRSKIARPTPRLRVGHVGNSRDLFEGLGGIVVVSTLMDKLSVKAVKCAEGSVAQHHRTSHDGVEDRLHIGWRAADDAQNFGCRRLASTSLAQLSFQLLDRATRSGCRCLGWHEDIQSFECSEKMPDHGRGPNPLASGDSQEVYSILRYAVCTDHCRVSAAMSAYRHLARPGPHPINV